MRNEESSRALATSRARARGDAWARGSFAAAVGLGAFLLFFVQPLLGRFILPWFGSTPAVWAASMVVFQTLLLAGYALAHGLARALPPSRQALWHLALASLAITLLPIIPAASWKPGADTAPAARIVLLLVATVGLPFVVLAAGGPLLQRWFAHACPGRSPYRLYALSNLGSLLALLCYPIVVEPRLRLATQAWIWSALYLGYLASLGAAVYAVRAAGRGSADAPATSTERVAPPTSFARLALWVGLSAGGSALLLATTNQMCQDVAVVPFLWVLPLALYLLTFIICFERARWYVRSLYLAALPVALVIACLVLLLDVDLGLGYQLAGYSVTLFVGCMLCHGELVRLRPPPARLTQFYLCMAAGGALGGLLVGIAAPLLLPELWEYHLALLACALLVLWAARHELPRLRRRDVVLWLVGLALLVVALAVQAAGWQLTRDDETRAWSLRRSPALVLSKLRGFYGVVQVQELGRPGSASHRLALQHGRILHGVQYTHADRRAAPSSYYAPDSGVGVALRLHPRASGPLRIGVIGLGAGTIAVYAGDGDTLRFYEINPHVVGFAGSRFSYVEDARARGADVEVLLGDARLVLERQLAADEPQRFDVLVVDAFSSDAIPMHLLTRECFAIYRAHLAEGGVIAINISNRHLDLRPVVRGLGDAHGMQTMLFATAGDSAAGYDAADWALVTSNLGFLESEAVAFASSELPIDAAPLLWTDDFGSVFELLRRARAERVETMVLDDDEV